VGIENREKEVVGNRRNELGPFVKEVLLLGGPYKGRWLRKADHSHTNIARVRRPLFIHTALETFSRKILRI